MLIVNWIIAGSLSSTTSTARLNLPYSVFRTQVQERNVAAVTATGETIQGELRNAIRYPAGKRGQTAKEFKTERPVFANDQTFQQLLADGATVGAKTTTPSTPLWQSLLLGFGPTLLLVGLFVLLMRGASRSLAGGTGSFAGFGKARARRYEPSEQRTTFKDVAGIDEATEELAEVVDFLKNPDRYRALGAMVPRGVPLTGPPGTGKTLLAKAVAGEADVPFFSMSASEFIEMIVGVGASRVRDLFEQAKKEAPAIIFIDELDAIGRSRAAGSIPVGGHDEREQTLNQVLTEMDGFTGNEGVIVLAATNRSEILDAALLRPGRFDRRVAVDPPDQQGREQILRVHPRSVPLARDVDLGAVASSTPGMVGADLRNLVNEAALLAARHGRRTVGRDGFADALEKIVLGAARHILISPEERERDRLSRGRPRAGRDARARRGSGAEGVDHPSRARSRGHVPESREGPLRLRRGVSARAHDRAARRARCGGAHLRGSYDWRGIRPRAGDCIGAADGRTLGHVRQGRARHGPAGRRRRAVRPARRRRHL
jgi:cell division protease FtsH